MNKPVDPVAVAELLATEAGDRTKEGRTERAETLGVLARCMEHAMVRDPFAYSDLAAFRHQPVMIIPLDQWDKPA